MGSEAIEKKHYHMYYIMSDKVCMDLMIDCLFIIHNMHATICLQLIM